jgi:ATP-dependent DNA helicase RecG
MSGVKLSRESRERINTMVRTNNGYEIAEADLKLRGPGDIEGTMQSGIMDLKLSSIVEDSGILNAARYYAQAIVDRDQDLQHPENQCIKYYLEQAAKRSKIWGRIS